MVFATLAEIMSRGRSGRHFVSEGIRNRLVLFSYKSGSVVLRYLPQSLARGLGIVGGTLAFAGFSKKRRLVSDNMRRAVGDDYGTVKINVLCLKAFVSYAIYWVEALGLGNASPSSLAARMSFSGLEHLYRALGSGKGAIITSPHLGNWDFGAAWFASKGNPIIAVMEEIEPKELLQWFAAHRVGFGVKAIPASPDSFKELVKALRANQVVALVADRDLSGAGIEMNFFGEVTTLPQGVALLALRTGTPIFPTAVYLLPGGGHFTLIRKPIVALRRGSLREDVERVTAQIVESYEVAIKADPAQWHLFQPNWPSQLEKNL